MNWQRHIVLLLGIGIFIAQDPPEEFQWNQSTQQCSYKFDTVTINGTDVEPDDWVGAFKGDTCVGALQWDLSECSGEVCSIVLMGQVNSFPETVALSE